MPIERDRLKQEYFRTAVQYYVTARYAACAGFLPVSGNLFHHAIEMHLKGYLCTNSTEDQLKKFGHKLQSLWARFKEDAADSALDSYDHTIEAVDKFERIRYPEDIIAKGIRATISFKNGPFAIETDVKHKQPKYDLCVHELDALAQIIFQMAKLNPKYFTTGMLLNSDASAYLKKFNEAPIW
jgi:hypothetical protein